MTHKDETVADAAVAEFALTYDKARNIGNAPPIEEQPCELLNRRANIFSDMEAGVDGVLLADEKAHAEGAALVASICAGKMMIDADGPRTDGPRADELLGDCIDRLMDRDELVQMMKEE